MNPALIALAIIQTIFLFTICFILSELGDLKYELAIVRKKLQQFYKPIKHKGLK